MSNEDKFDALFKSIKDGSIDKADVGRLKEHLRFTYEPILGPSIYGILSVRQTLQGMIERRENEKSHMELRTDNRRIISLNVWILIISAAALVVALMDLYLRK